MSEVSKKRVLASGIVSHIIDECEVLEIAQEQAEELLPPAILNLAEKDAENGCYLFQKSWCIDAASLASPIIFEAMTRDLELTDNQKHGARLGMAEQVGKFAPDIMTNLGYSEQQLFKARKNVRDRQDALRAEKDPNLVISAQGAWRSFQKGKVFLVTADGQRHFADKAKYRMRSSYALNLLNDYNPEPYCRPHDLFPSYLIEVINEPGQIDMVDNSVRMIDVLDTLADDFRAALLDDAEYRKLPAPSTHDSIEKTHKLVRKAITEHEWPKDHPLADEEFRHKCLIGAHKKMRDRAAQFVALDPMNLST